MIQKIKVSAGEFPQDVLEELCGPFLISVPQEFKNASRKILFVGQETYGWIPFKNLLESGENFKNESKIWYEEFDYAQGPKALRSPFWRFHRQLSQGLGLDYRSLLWTNLVRFDRINKENKRASILQESYAEILLKAQNGILRSEIENNNIENVIFLTGPYYDYIIQQEFLRCEFTEISKTYSKNQASLVFANDYPNVRMIRTYHPRYLQHSGMFQGILRTCIDFIKS